MKYLSNDSSGTIRITCPIGKRIRVCAVLADLTMASVGDSIMVELGTQNQTVARSQVCAQDTTVALSAALHCSQTQAMQSVVDVVTGAVTNVVQIFHCTPLPDLWFDADVVVNLPTGTVNAMFVAYEEHGRDFYANPTRLHAKH